MNEKETGKYYDDFNFWDHKIWFSPKFLEILLICIIFLIYLRVLRDKSSFENTSTKYNIYEIISKIGQIKINIIILWRRWCQSFSIYFPKISLIFSTDYCPYCYWAFAISLMYTSLYLTFYYLFLLIFYFSLLTSDSCSYIRDYICWRLVVFEAEFTPIDEGGKFTILFSFEGKWIAFSLFYVWAILFLNYAFSFVKSYSFDL